MFASRYLAKFFSFSLTIIASAPPCFSQDITRIAIISSYHADLYWEKETNEGLLQAFEESHLITQQQIQTFIRKGKVKNNKIMLMKWWMDSKRKNSIAEIQTETIRIIKDLKRYRPDIVITGDDNATNFIGNHFIDSPIPLIFYGINGNPMKYGLLDSLEHPGRNITGVYQGDYLLESINFLKDLLPEIQTFAVLADDSVTSRAQIKKIHRLAENQLLPLTLIEVVSTNSYDLWRRQAKLLSQKVDAFLILNHNTLHTDKQKPIGYLQAGAWYLKNIQIPEVTPQEQFIKEGMLAGINDSGFTQGYEAGLIAMQILSGQSPATIKVSSPPHGDFAVNKKRARMLGLLERIQHNPRIENWTNTSHALDQAH